MSQKQRYIVASCDWEEAKWRVDFVEADDPMHAQSIVEEIGEELCDIVAFTPEEWKALADRSLSCDAKELLNAQTTLKS